MWVPVGTAAVHDAQAAVAQPDHSGSRTVHSWDCTRWAGIQSVSYRAFELDCGNGNDARRDRDVELRANELLRRDLRLPACCKSTLA